MALTIEDGTIVTGANSFVSRADYIAYAATIGVTIADDAAADIELIKAGEFINQHEDNLIGSLVSRDQAMSFPRNNLAINGWPYGGNEIPRAVTLCQMAFALDVHNGYDLWNPSANPNLVTKREKVEGAVEVEYAVSENAPQRLTRTSMGQSYLSALLKTTSLYSIGLVRA